MLSPEYIREQEKKATKEASRRNLLPYVFWNTEDVYETESFPFPVLGEHEPKGWERIDELFCDASGWGAPDEPALTQEQLRAKIVDLIAEHGRVGFGITTVGQFQLYVGVYIKQAR